MDKGMEFDNLTTRQWHLHNFLMDHAGHLFKLKQLYLELIEEYPVWKIGQVEWANSLARREITRDLHAIAKCKRIQKILIRDERGVGFLGEKETKKVIEKRYNEAKRIMADIWQDIKRAENDQQVRLVFGKEREVFEAFANTGA